MVGMVDGIGDSFPEENTRVAGGGEGINGDIHGIATHGPECRLVFDYTITRLLNYSIRR
jgi:hypothetical protein